MSLLALRLPEPERLARQAAVRESFLARARPVGGAALLQLRPSHLEALFGAYDATFFEGALGRGTGGRVSFGLNPRLRTSAGLCRYYHRERRFSIELSGELLSRSFGAGAEPLRVNGLPCTDRLEAASRVFEHELCHLVEFLETDRSSCQGRPFQRLAEGLFGHREHTHRLKTHRSEAYGSGLLPGTTVRFHHRDRILEGILAQVTKRATVLVPDPEGGWIDGSGRRVAKFYVPLKHLERLR